MEGAKKDDIDLLFLSGFTRGGRPSRLSWTSGCQGRQHLGAFGHHWLKEAVQIETSKCVERNQLAGPDVVAVRFEWGQQYSCPWLPSETPKSTESQVIYVKT